MTMILIATTRAEEMQPLGLGGQLVIDAASSIQAIVRRSLSPAHAALYAEPERDQVRGEIDWYAQGPGPAVRLVDMADPARGQVEAVLQRLTADIAALAARLAESEEASERRLGEMLKLSQRLPSDRCVMVLQGQPVLAAWGHAPAATGNQGLAVTGQVRAPIVNEPMTILPPPAAIQAATPAAGLNAAGAPPAAAGGGLAWPLLAAAALLLVPALLLLQHDFTLMEAGRVCRISRADLAAVEKWRQAELRGTDLDAQLASLTAQAAAAQRQCPTPPGGTAPAAGGGA